MKRNIHIFIAIGLILMTAVARIVNHDQQIYNLAPVGAIGLFGGAALKDRRLAFIMPLLALLISDIYIQMFPNNPLQRGFYGIEQLFVYGGMALATLLGTRMGKITAPKVLGYSLSASAIFFIVSNLGSFVSGMYGYSVEGFFTTYLMALPFYTPMGTTFFLNTFAGDALFSGLLFGSFYLLQQTVPTGEPVRVKA